MWPYLHTMETTMSIYVGWEIKLIWYVENREVLDDRDEGGYVNLLRHRTIPSPNTEVYTLPLTFKINVELSWIITRGYPKLGSYIDV